MHNAHTHTYSVMYINYIYEARKTKHTTTKKRSHSPSSFLWICYAFGKREKGKKVEAKISANVRLHVLSFEWNETAWNINEKLRHLFTAPDSNIEQCTTAYKWVWFVGFSVGLVYLEYEIILPWSMILFERVFIALISVSDWMKFLVFRFICLSVCRMHSSKEDKNAYENLCMELHSPLHHCLPKFSPKTPNAELESKRNGSWASLIHFHFKLE